MRVRHRRGWGPLRDARGEQEGEAMAGRLKDKVALITGGGSGIGRACAVRFAEEGAAVCAADLNLEGAAETVRLVEQAGGRALALEVDTTDEAANEMMVARCVEAFGAVDILVAAAGISGARPGAAGQEPPRFPTLTVPMEHFRRVIDVNFYGVLFSNRAAARWMVANGRPGSIINLASIMAKVPSGGAYSISKAAVWMLTKALALELAPAGIRVNAIGPGFIETPMTAMIREDEARLQMVLARTPMGRMGQPIEVAHTALFLASDESSYFTGELLHPSGGYFVG
jgi:NAD(P)-dependent dehydrogenase (short-subunit alcohol dehydrogenase family)